jgi:hypothetical protein
VNQPDWTQRIERDIDNITDWVWRYNHVYSRTQTENNIRQLLQNLIRDVELTTIEQQKNEGKSKWR